MTFKAGYLRNFLVGPTDVLNNSSLVARIRAIFAAFFLTRNPFFGPLFENSFSMGQNSKEKAIPKHRPTKNPANKKAQPKSQAKSFKKSIQISKQQPKTGAARFSAPPRFWAAPLAAPRCCFEICIDFLKDLAWLFGQAFFSWILAP